MMLAMPNIRSSYPLNPRPGRGSLLVDSDSAALGWWDHERNDPATFRTVTVRALRLCHWLCPQCGLRFEAKVNDMTTLGPKCPQCEARRSKEFNEQYEVWKRTPIADVPELLAAWAGDFDPRMVMVVGGNYPHKFRCPQGHLPSVDALRFMSMGCPHCRGAKTAQNKRWLADILPEIASQWHPTRNGDMTPHNVVWDSKRQAWWQSDCCDYEWQESVKNRDKYERLRCPACERILDSFAWRDPGLAAEWSPTNPISAWHLRPHAKVGFLPEWICATNPAHIWQAELSSRSNGAECPECKQAGKSRVELAHHQAARTVFGNARSGAILRDTQFTTRRRWTVDIAIDLDQHTVIVEYDGAYWHRAPAKMLVDQRKTQDLLAAGHVVVRLREDDLPMLDITHPRCLQIQVDSAAPRPLPVMQHIQQWLPTVAELSDQASDGTTGPGLEA